MQLILDSKNINPRIKKVNDSTNLVPVMDQSWQELE